MIPAPVLVTGANGQLGDAVVRALAGRDVMAWGRTACDITDAGAVQRAVAAAAPHAIVNCAAFNDVDGAEDAPADAFATNAFAVRSLARAADACGAALIHFGSDFVFGGAETGEGRPLTEDVAPTPRSVYAASKLVGDWFALQASRGFVLRVESLFGTPPGWAGRRGTLEKMVDAFEAGRPVSAFTDRIVSPSYIDDVAAAARHLLDAHAAPGLYHCVNSGYASWHDVATETARLLGTATPVVPLSVDDVAMKAARPRFCALDNGKLAAAGFVMPAWQDALRRWVAARTNKMRQAE